jgi:hypothetical protein
MLFDFSTQKWVELAKLNVNYHSWSRDSKYIYADTFGGASGFFRIRISDRRLDWIARIKDLRRTDGTFGTWSGLTPDDSPLLVRDTGTQEIYALDWQIP